MAASSSALRRSSSGSLCPDSDTLPRRKSSVSGNEEAPKVSSWLPQGSGVPPRSSSLTLEVPFTGDRSPSHTPRSNTSQPVSPARVPRSPIDTTGPVAIDWSIFKNQEAIPPSFNGVPKGPPTQSYEVHNVQTYTVDLGELPRQRSSSFTMEPARSPRADLNPFTPGLGPRTSSVTLGVPRPASDRSPVLTPRSATNLRPTSPFGATGSEFRPVSPTNSINPADSHTQDWSFFKSQEASAPSFDGAHHAPPTTSYEVHEVKRYPVDLGPALPRRSSSTLLEPTTLTGATRSPIRADIPSVPMTGLGPRTSSVTLGVSNAASDRSPSLTPRSATNPRPASPFGATGSEFRPVSPTNSINPADSHTQDWSFFKQQEASAPSFDGVHNAPPTTSSPALPRGSSSTLLEPTALTGATRSPIRSPRADIAPAATAVPVPAPGLGPRASSVTLGVPGTASDRSPALTPRSATNSQPTSPFSTTVTGASRHSEDWSLFKQQETLAASFDGVHHAPPTKSYEVHEVKTYSVDLGPALPRRSSSTLLEPTLLTGATRSPIRSPRADIAPAATAVPVPAPGLGPRASSVTLGVPGTASDRSPALTPRSATNSRPTSPANAQGRARSPSLTDSVDRTGPVAVDWSVFKEQETVPPRFDGTPKAPPTKTYENHEVRRWSVDLGAVPLSRSSSVSSQPSAPHEVLRFPRADVDVATGLGPRTSSSTLDVPHPTGDRSPSHTPRNATNSRPTSPSRPTGQRSPSPATVAQDWSVFKQQEAVLPSFDITPKAPPTQSYETHEVRKYSVDLDSLPRRSSSTTDQPPQRRDSLSARSPRAPDVSMTATPSVGSRKSSATLEVPRASPFQSPRAPNTQPISPSNSARVVRSLSPTNPGVSEDWSVFQQQETIPPSFDGTHKAPPTRTSEVHEVRTYSIAP